MVLQSHQDGMAKPSGWNNNTIRMELDYRNIPAAILNRHGLVSARKHCRGCRQRFVFAFGLPQETHELCLERRANFAWRDARTSLGETRELCLERRANFAWRDTRTLLGETRELRLERKMAAALGVFFRRSWNISAARLIPARRFWYTKGESGDRPRLGWRFLREDGCFLRVRDCDVGE